jgi:hypothetical protein
VLHVLPHAVPSQVAVAFAGVVHGVQEVVPHDMTLVLDEHAPEQMW